MDIIPLLVGIGALYMSAFLFYNRNNFNTSSFIYRHSSHESVVLLIKVAIIAELIVGIMGITIFLISLTS